MGKIEFEFGAEGPKARFNPFEKAQDAIAVRLARLRQQLNIRADAAALAAAGSPPHDQPEPSAKEREIYAGHVDLADERVRRGELILMEKVAELETLAINITASDLDEATAKLKSRLGEIRTLMASAIRPLLEAKWKAREALRMFETVNQSANRPTGRSFIEYVGATLLTGIAEGLIGGFLFQEEAGYAPGIGLAFGIGCIFALAGTGIGVGWANVLHAAKRRKVAGCIMLAIALPLTLFLLIVIAHYRIALTGGSPDLPVATKSSLFDHPLAPLFDGKALIYMGINVACVWLVAWEASRFLGWLDLRRARLNAEKTDNAVKRCHADALYDCEVAKGETLDAGDDAVEAVGEDAVRTKTVAGECKAVCKEVGDDLRAIERAQETCQMEYRETFASVSRAGWEQARFDVAIPTIDVAGLTLDPSVHAISHALEARSIKIREAQPAFKAEAYRLTDETRQQLDRDRDEIENEVRFVDRLKVVR